MEQDRGSLLWKTMRLEEVYLEPLASHPGNFSQFLDCFPTTFPVLLPGRSVLIRKNLVAYTYLNRRLNQGVTTHPPPRLPQDVYKVSICRIKYFRHLGSNWGGLFVVSCASLVAQMVKNLPAVRETWVQSLIRKMPWKSGWQPTPVLLPGKSHGQRSLAGYSPQGRKESDTTERLTLSLSFLGVKGCSVDPASLPLSEHYMGNCQLWWQVWWIKR